MPGYSGFENFATEGTKGRRRALRSDVRRLLGTSSEPAPNVWQALAAAGRLQRILDLASGGRYGLVVVDMTKLGRESIEDSILFTSTAIQHVEVENAHGKTRIGPCADTVKVVSERDGARITRLAR